MEYNKKWLKALIITFLLFIVLFGYIIIQSRPSDPFEGIPEDFSFPSPIERIEGV